MIDNSCIWGALGAAVGGQEEYQPGPPQICLSHPLRAAGPHFHGALARVYKAAFFPPVPTARRAAGNSSDPAGQVGAGTWGR